MRAKIIFVFFNIKEEENKNTQRRNLMAVKQASFRYKKSNKLNAK